MLSYYNKKKQVYLTKQQVSLHADTVQQAPLHADTVQQVPLHADTVQQVPLHADTVKQVIVNYLHCFFTYKDETFLRWISLL